MALTGEEKKIIEDGQDKDAFVIYFTNGALGQLNELVPFFKKENKLELVKLAISILQLAKEQDERKQNQNNKG